MEFSSFSSLFFVALVVATVELTVVVTGGVYFGGVVVFSNVNRRSAVVSMGEVEEGSTANFDFGLFCAQ